MTIVVGHSPNRSDPAPIELAATFARSVGTDLRVVVVVPAGWPTPVVGAPDHDYRAWSRELGERAVAEARSFLAGCGDDLPVEVVAVPARSAAGALEDEAVASDAGMVLVGSAVSGDRGRVVVGSTAGWLLHSSAIPVGIATVGYRSPTGGRIARATCAFRADKTSQFALARTAELCRETGAKLRVATFGVLGTTMYPPEVLGERQVLEAYVESTAAAQGASVTALPDGGAGVETVVATGRNWPEALGRLDWNDSDVLVVGSSTRGVLSRVFIGTMATRIVRHSPVPVVVVPR